VNPGVSTREPPVAPLLTGLMHDAQKLLRQEMALVTHELRRELRNTIRAVTSLSIGIGIATIGGWLLILMLVHLLQALTALPLWACYGIVGGCWPRVEEGCSSSARRRWRRCIWCPRTRWTR
jgi:Putative Actinobacterial Holin-X, holin superfamily III